MDDFKPEDEIEKIEQDGEALGLIKPPVDNNANSE
jgi:hypothetical protein